MPFGIDARFDHDFDQHLPRHMMGTGKSDKQPFIRKELKGAEMDFFVTAPSAVQRLARLRKRWRIKHNQIVLRSLLDLGGEKIENVVVSRINLNAVQLSILLDCPGESFVALHRGQTSRAPSGAGKGKRPLVRKTIKYPLAAR